jgi:hypothetical protein
VPQLGDDESAKNKRASSKNCRYASDGDTGRARSALNALDPNCDRETWVRIGMAAKHAGLSVDDFISWSRGASNFGGEKDCRAQWRSFKRGMVTDRTLFRMALDSGWSDPRRSTHGTSSSRPAESRKPGDRNGHHFDFAAVWRDAEAATAEHPYIKRNRGLPEGLRVYHGPLRVAGQPVDGALLVPAYDGVDKLQTWQAIPAEPGTRKLNAPGRPVRGCFMVGGDPLDGDPIFVCEGISGAWPAHMATRGPAAVCFGAGRTKQVAQDLRTRWPGARIVLVADTGKEDATERLARDLDCAWVAPPADLGDNADIGDLRQRDGLQAVASLLAKVRVPAPEGMPQIKNSAELMRRAFEPIRWLVPGMLPEGLMLLAARPKVGKSWFAAGLAIACATGGHFLGRPVTVGDVLYLALEDNDRRMQNRLTKLHAAGAGLEHLEYATEWPRGAEGANAIHWWINTHPNARLVVIDVFTKLRAVAEGRETAYSTDYADVSILKPPADRGVSILLIHHTRKAEAEDPLDNVSGTLGIGGAADGALIIKRARGSDEAELHVIGRDLEEEGAFAIRFDRQSCRWHWMGEAWRVRLTAERRQALDALTAEPMKPHELAKSLSKSPGAVRKMIHGMCLAGQIARGPDGKYRPAASE